jgi:hypothetical protein
MNWIIWWKIIILIMTKSLALCYPLCVAYVS